MRILVGGPVREDHIVFAHFVDCLRKQELYPGIEMDLMFMLDSSGEEQKRLAGENAKILREGEYKFFAGRDARDPRIGVNTHEWSRDSLGNVATVRNIMLELAAQGAYDYLFMVDSDVLLKPQTLLTLLGREKEIVCEVFWTKWQPDSQPMPNVWDYDQYSFSHSHGFERLKEPGCYRVGMGGACTLISSDVIDQRDIVNYSPLQNISLWGEDRHFCIRAATVGFDVWADTTCTPEHIYRREDLDKWLSSERM